MKKRVSITATTIAATVTASQALAHTGHGAIPGESLLHHLIEPAHGAIALLAVLFVGLGVGIRKRVRSRS